MSNPSSKIILIMAGGTGGHVYPALALARELTGRGHRVEWLGTSRGIESRLVPAAGIPLHILSIGGVRGLGFGTKVRAPLRITKAVAQALGVMRVVKPDVVVGLGGFAAGPGGVAAKLLRKPLVIHEQNAIAGTTNKLLARIATLKLTAFPEALPGSVCIGNPVRREIEQLPAPSERLAERQPPRRLLVLGGSLGAAAINKTVPEAIAKLPVDVKPIVLHQTGEKHLVDTQQHYRDNEVEGEVVPYIEDMAEALSWADLVVCRAGALTVAELAAAGLPAILIPFPYAIDDHQTANAQFLVDAGAGVLRQQKDLTSDDLAKLLTELLADHQVLQQMATRARTKAVPGTAEKFADFCLELVHD